MVQEKIDQFIKNFLPGDVPPEKVGQWEIILTPHGLLYDFTGKYPHTFTIKQLKACLSAYLAMIDDLIAELQEHRDTTGHLYLVGHDNASELLLAYFQRTNKDADYADFIAYLIAVDAVGQVQRLLKVVDPHEALHGVDACKRIVSVHSILRDLAKTASSNHSES